MIIIMIRIIILMVFSTGLAPPTQTTLQSLTFYLHFHFLSDRDDDDHELMIIIMIRIIILMMFFYRPGSSNSNHSSVSHFLSPHVSPVNSPAIRFQSSPP